MVSDKRGSDELPTESFRGLQGISGHTANARTALADIVRNYAAANTVNQRTRSILEDINAVLRRGAGPSTGSVREKQQTTERLVLQIGDLLGNRAGKEVSDVGERPAIASRDDRKLPKESAAPASPNVSESGTRSTQPQQQSEEAEL
jgi:hypothetical protein